MTRDAVPVLIVDDQAPFRRAARAVMAATPGFEVVGEAESGEEAVELVDRLHPALVLMDINLGAMNGIEATRRITAAHPDATVLLLSTYRAADLPAGADSCGAVGYVNKEEFGPAVVVDAWSRRAEVEHGHLVGPRPRHDERAGGTLVHASRPQQGERGMTAVEGFDHMTIVVTALQDAKDFLALLGFVEARSVLVSGEEMSGYIGIPDWEADHVTLVLEGVSPRQEVQLLHFHRPDPSPDPFAGSLSRVGFNHVCFRVADLDAVLDRLAEHGISPRNSVMEFHDRRLVFVDGPAGVCVELAEWVTGGATGAG